AEEIVRSSGLDYTVIKAGIIYGRGDHMLDHLSRALLTMPLFALVGMKDRPVRPIAVEDMARILQASLVEGRLSRQTVAVTGPEKLAFSEAVRRVARVIGKRPYLFHVPVTFHYLLAWCFERVMVTPLISLAQVRMLAEGIAEPLPVCQTLPDDLMPREFFTEQQIRQGLPEARPFGLKDLRWFT
ncbi:MAG: nucleoside-diphosphate sugar epimerase, partial [Acidobacteriota bacterium]